MEKLIDTFVPTMDLSTTIEVLNKVKDMKDLTTEYFKLAFVRNNSVLMVEDFTKESTPQYAEIDVEKMEEGVELAGDMIDVDVVMIHNHPDFEDGVTFVSDQDIINTKIGEEKFALKGVKLLEHFVVSTCKQTKEAVFYTLSEPQRFYLSHVEQEYKSMKGGE